MASTEVEVHFQLSAGELQGALRAVLIRSTWFRLFLAMGVVLAVTGLALGAVAGFANPAVIESPFLLVLCIGQYLYWPGGEIKRELLLKPQSIRFTDDLVEWQTAEGDARMKWGLFEKGVKAGDFYLLHISRRVSLMIPERAFTTTNRLNFDELLSRKLG
jgi:hypothetical protein